MVTAAKNQRMHFGDDEPIRLAVAAAAAFPDGSMSASGLRREAAKGRLAIERIAGRDYTTLQAIQQMRTKCRVEAKALASGFSQLDGTSTDKSSSVRSGSSATAALNEALAAARVKLRKLKERSPIISTANTEPREISQRDPAACKVADVIAIYADDVAHKHSRPKETAARLDQVLDLLGDKTLADINRKTCEDYVNRRGVRGAARRELEDLRAAIRHHWEAGLCAALTPVVLPERGRRASAG